MIKVYSYPFMVKTWVDGDTAHGVIDKGHGLLWEPKKGIRLVHADGRSYDAPERKGATLTRANRARDWINVLAPAGTWLMATSHHKGDLDDFGRPLCSLLLMDGMDLADAMVMAGYVK